MKPTADRVIILADKPKEKTASGFYIKEDWKTLPPMGIVQEVGPDVKTVKKGDRVLFERYGSVILKDDLRVCIENQILAIVEDEEA